VKGGRAHSSPPVKGGPPASNQFMMNRFTCTLLGLLLVSVLASYAASPIPAVTAGDLTADQILSKISGSTTMTGNGQALIELITVNRQGKQRSHKLEIFRKQDEESTKQLLVYLSPPDVAGTKFLSIDNADNEETNMWLYLPALGREKRISGGATKGKFLDTDFTFEEIGGTTGFTENYDAERLADEMLNGREAYVLDLTAKGEDSDYSHVKLWVWKHKFVPLQIEFYSKRNKPVKRLVNDELEENENGEWQPRVITMSDVEAGTKTIIVINETKETHIPEIYFTKRYLRR